MLGDTDYAGTFSTLDVSAKTGKERRGKVRCNKLRNPRTRNAAVTSECVSYNVADLDSEGKPTRGTIFHPATKQRTRKLREVAAPVQPDVLRYASIVGYTGDVD